MIKGLKGKLISAGLPVVDADDSGAVSFSRALTDAERLTMGAIVSPQIAMANKAKADKHKSAIQALRARPLSGEKSVVNLRDRVALIEEILGLEE